MLSHTEGDFDSFANLEREKWPKKIGGLWRWSEAVPLLKEYYALNGIGRLAFEQGVSLCMSCLHFILIVK